jgi:uncharacterized protein (TIGR03435 family)
MKTVPGIHVLYTVLLFAIGSTWIMGVSQQQNTPRPVFEAATVKPSNSDRVIPGGPAEARDYFAWNGQKLKTLISFAWRMRKQQIEGGPGWIDSQLWDSEAKPKEGSIGPNYKRGDLKGNEISLMLQSLIEERFKLQVERQTKPAPVYNLVVAKGGLKMTADDGKGPVGDAWAPAPGAIQSKEAIVSGGSKGRSIEGRATRMELIVQTLQARSDRAIVDLTNLKGNYTFKIEWPVDDPAAGDSPLARSDQSFGPAFFTALQEQAGLRLEPAKGPVEFLVIKSVQKPEGIK